MNSLLRQKLRKACTGNRSCAQKLTICLGLLAKHADMKAAAEAAEAQKQALLETADAFRGVHLDPNAHHWDDVNESDFLLLIKFDC